ncbi:MAG TPA: Fe-S cluster assembly ATPase SufC [Bacilli bacterium]|nr:Fe-S cluster assembly ATPase SufC [Bacilli bacterium]
MLEISNLQVKVAKQTIIEDLNLKVNEGEIHCLIGPNGAGKSTIAKIILKDPNYEVTKGSIIYNNKDLKTLTTDQISRLGLMLISQHPLAIEGVSNADMLIAALRSRSEGQVDIFAVNQKLTKICQELAIPQSFIHRQINEGMSGGERKKNELMHVWLLEPKLLIADEIDSGLDIDALQLVINSLKKYHTEKQASIVLITHNPQIIEMIEPNFIHILNDKTIVKTGGLELLQEIKASGFTTYKNGVTKDE